ncbi:MAG: RdgB/HAM1 family non-canonical purine NTP pyrophosphatase [Lactobacillus sp.]|jgi:XTP/dITP diphosphohydrolase|nr:RdgB/HAM1 family non-canonical purine NTP pyrophosphatase [Lactobacillus sp.]
MILDKLVIASNNQGKIVEIRQMLEPYGVEVFSAGELGLPDVEETETTFEGNARLKADTLCRLSKLPCLADDSGLCVNALGGRPGVYSARYAPDRNWVKGMEMLLAELKASGSDDRTAYFECVLAFAMPNVDTKVFSGRVDGVITKKMSGPGGFGYDPIFQPDGFDKTFGNFTAADKAEVSHRGRAFEKFIKEVLVGE